MRDLKMGYRAGTAAICAALMTVFSLPAMAQMTDPDGTPYSTKYYRKKPDTMNISLARVPGGAWGDFVLRVVSDYGMSGCPKISNIGYSSELQGGTVAVVIGDYSLDMRDLPSAPQYQCASRQFYPTAEIPLNATALASNNINQVRFEIPGPRFEVYDLKQGDDYVQLTPGPLLSPRPKIHPLQNEYVKNSLKLWLYPEKTVILKVGGVDDTVTDVKKAVQELAESKGMTPLESVIKDFKSPLADPNSFYYVDNRSAVTGDAKAMDGVQVGTVSVSSVVQTIDGGQTVNRTVAVFAHTPGAYE